MNTIKLTESRLKSIITEAVKQALNENMGQQYRIDLKTSSLTNQQTSRQIRSLLNSGKPTECTLNMFYGNAFSCDATFTTKGNTTCTINIVCPNPGYNKTFEWDTGTAVGQALNTARSLCQRWLESIQTK